MSIQGDNSETNPTEVPTARCRKLLSLISRISAGVRACQQEPVFCENITFTQFHILDQIISEEVLRLSELHERLGVEKSTTTRLVEPLIRRELVEKSKCGNDSRCVILKPTEEGKKLQTTIWQCLRGFFGSIEERLPESNRNQIYDSVRTFLDALQGSCGNKLKSD